MIFELNAHNKLEFEADEGLCCHNFAQLQCEQDFEKLVQVDLYKKLHSWCKKLLERGLLKTNLSRSTHVLVSQWQLITELRKRSL